MAEDETARIAKVLARAGIASRRDAEVMIAEGRVSVNGKQVDSPALNVGPTDRIAVDGRDLPPPEPARLWRYHKPEGLVTSARDEQGRPTVFDRLPEGMPRVMSVGRLDITSEGLLLLTNDGEVKRRLELPATGWLRRYRVRVHGTPSDAALQPLREGITLDGERFQPMELRLDRQQGANAWLTVGIREGRNREVRRAMEAVGLTVNRLIRTGYGPFQLGDLAPGAVEEIPARILRDQLGLARPDAPAEGRPTSDRKRSDGKSAPRASAKPGAKPGAKPDGRGSPLPGTGAARPNRDDGAERGARPPRGPARQGPSGPGPRRDAADSRPARAGTGDDSRARPPRARPPSDRPVEGAGNRPPRSRSGDDTGDRLPRARPVEATGARAPRPRSDDKPRPARSAGDAPRPDRKPRAATAERAAGERPTSGRPKSERPRSERPKSDWSNSDRPRPDRPRPDRPRPDRPQREGTERADRLPATRQAKEAAAPARLPLGPGPGYFRPAARPLPSHAAPVARDSDAAADPSQPLAGRRRRGKPKTTRGGATPDKPGGKPGGRAGPRPPRGG